MAKSSTIIRQRLFGPIHHLMPFDHLIPLEKQVTAIRAIMRELESQRNKSIDFIIALDSFEPLAVRFQRFESVATYSLVRRRQNEPNAELCAIGLLLSGVDPAYDEAVVAGVETMNDDSGAPLPFDHEIFRQIRSDQQRPMSAAYFFKEAPMEDPAMRWAVRSLAEVFFGMIGVFKPV